MAVPQNSYDRWYAIGENCETRPEAVAFARLMRTHDEPGWVFRVVTGNHGFYVQKAKRMTPSEMAHTRYWNRRFREDASGQRKLF